MPAIKHDEMIGSILEAFEESGHPGLLLSSKSRHPRRFLIQTETGSVEIWIYIWTLTHGGRPSLPDEYRIQMTTVSSPLVISFPGYTVLLGYEPNLKLFGGFDINRHRSFTSGSPSVQIDINCLYKALQDGLAFDRKSNDEIAVGIRPDQLINYIANAQALHELGSKALTYKLLTKASALEKIPDSTLTKLTKKRRNIVTMIKRLSREASFRQQVLSAYGNRCAITRMQLRLVDAAHILPVGAEGSTDNVSNGLALSPTYHRAFDSGLIYLNEDFVIDINHSKELNLQTLRLDGGLNEFKSFLERRIHLPQNRGQWPNLAFIQKANKLRHIS
jgi:putative restriction endonuclease